MTKRLAVSVAVLGAFLLLPVAIGDFQSVAPAQALSTVPEPGTLVLLAAGLIGARISKLRRSR